MEIVLIRHGEPEWVRDGLAVVDPPLTEADWFGAFSPPFAAVTV